MADRKPGRPKVYTEQRVRVYAELPPALVEEIDALTDNRTEFIEEAAREHVKRRKKQESVRPSHS